MTTPPESARGPSASGSRTRVRYEVVAAACLLALVAYVHRVGFAWACPYLKADLQLTDADLGNVMTAFLIAYGLFEIPWGLIGDRFGPKYIFMAAVLGWSLLTAATPLIKLVDGASRQVVVLITLRFLFGAFQAGAFPAISRLLADWIPFRERGTAQGLVWMSSRIGGAIAPLIMFPLVAWKGWPAGLVIVSSLGFLWCAVSWPRTRNRPEESPRVNDAELALITAERVRRPASHSGFPWKRLVCSRNIWALFLMYACGGYTASFFVTLLPNYLRTHRHLTEEEATWVSSVPLACGIFACLWGGMISDWIIRRTGNRKWGRRLNGVVGYVGAGFAILATIWVHDVWALAALLSAAFLCFDLTMGPAWAACADIGERHAGTLGGAMNMVGNFGAALGSKVAGSLFGKTVWGMPGDDLVFILFACSFWLGAVCWLRVDVTKPLEIGESVRAT